ncbi:helix-turn-helix domain-containing protein [Thiocystis violacea]|uniref:helix-turn-helix domain-containing protein n=1 Tax=Thiocystis violacea TaxID=13725 RepID=UPI0019074D14|nr:transcriptional regulator [Thiocystis violacea]
MPSNVEPLNESEIEAYEANRDLAADLLQAVEEMKAGEGRVVWSPALAARQETGLSQAQFAQLLGVSVRTLQGWEQGRKQPSGAARTLLAIARRNPKVLRDVAEDLRSGHSR